ncbi:MAG: hypothetical protein J5528_04370 [Firmicutes bacterium]|nr:hypothetical protein [Bacillota bacterium]
MESRKIVRLITSVLISIALWVYVINVVNPSSTTTIRNVPVTLTGMDTLYANNLAIEGSGDYTVDITVRGTRTDLSTLPMDNIVATADVSELTLGQDFITVEVAVPREYTVEDIRSRKIQVYVDELETKTVPVEVVYTGSSKNGYEATVLSVYPEYIEVYGAKKLVAGVGGFVVTVDASNLEYEKVSELSLTGQVRDSAGNDFSGKVRVDDPVILVAATNYSTKSVVLNTGYYGQPWAGASVNKITTPSTITVKGPMSILAEVTEVYSEDIDIEGIYGDAEFPIVPILPEGIYLSEKDRDIKLEIDLADTGSVEFFYYPYEIATKDLADNLYASYSLSEEAYITATVTGPIATLRTMSAADVTLSVDGSKFILGNTTVKITASTQISGVNISLSPETVSVYVREK